MSEVKQQRSVWRPTRGVYRSLSGVKGRFAAGKDSEGTNGEEMRERDHPPP